MKNKTVKILSMLLTLALLFSVTAHAVEENVTPSDAASVSTQGIELSCASAILMDAATGAVLYEKNADEALPPASVTKVMTLLLVMEAVESGRIALTDRVSVSAHAASMGGSQVYLKEGETLTVEEMLKCVVIASANDCAVALAEFVAGSEEQFVSAMNTRAAELGMQNTHFENTNGLDDTVQNHVTSARDIAIMSRALIAYPKILEYSGIWMDSIRDGAFGLTNTNRLVRFYPGCTGLKTGSTARAGFCVSATAERDGLSLICVIMKAGTRDIRNAEAARLLDFGFANYATYRADAGESTLTLTGGVSSALPVKWGSFCATVSKGEAGNVKVSVELPESLAAPVEKDEQVGRVVYSLNGEELGSVPVLADESVSKIGFGTLFWRMLSSFLMI